MAALPDEAAELREPSAPWNGSPAFSQFPDHWYPIQVKQKDKVGRPDVDDPHVHFTKTKSHRDRIVPVNPDVVDILLRLKAQTLEQGGPFIGMGNNLGRMWARIVQEAKVLDVTIHDLRRTFVTRLVREGVPMPTVQKLAGHANVNTTLRYYTWISNDDLRAGIKKLRRDVG